MREPRERDDPRRRDKHRRWNLHRLQQPHGRPSAKVDPADRRSGFQQLQMLGGSQHSGNALENWNGGLRGLRKPHSDPVGGRPGARKWGLEGLRVGPHADPRKHCHDEGSPSRGTRAREHRDYRKGLCESDPVSEYATLESMAKRHDVLRSRKDLYLHASDRKSAGAA